MLRLLLALSLTAGPAFSQTPPEVRSMINPTSSVFVRILDARVTDLECGGRGAKFEWTKHSARLFPYMSKSTFRDADPREIAVGLFAMLLLVPVTVASAPADLLAMPFRRECSFTLSVDGRLEEWAGRAAPRKAVGLDTRNLLEPGVQGVAAPRLFSSSGTAAADEEGRFSISVPGWVGRSKELLLRWTVGGLEANRLSLRKTGSTFTLSEEDPGFGTGVHENETREIRPVKKK